jgi:hypothetical protein
VSEPPWSAVVDDGELEDVRALLEELGVDFVHYRKGSFPEMGWEPRQMLVATATHAVSLQLRRMERKKKGQAVWIAVTDGSRTQERLMIRSGFDFLVQRPVHPSALRMFLQYVVYGGKEQRRVKRLAVGHGVKYCVGARWRKATLIDLSPRGCRLLARDPVVQGTVVTVQFPSEMTGGSPFDLDGEVMRTRRGELESGGPEEVAFAIRFNPLYPLQKDRLHTILTALSSGPWTLPPKAAAGLQASPSASSGEAVTADPAGPDRRKPRGLYQEGIAPFGHPEPVFVGRDLSQGGLRVDPHPLLTVGACLRLVIQGGADTEPVVVEARVVRDDGEHGVALQFDWIEHRGRERLDAIVASLPAIQSLQPDRPRGQDVVLAQLVPRLLRLRR